MRAHRVLLDDLAFPESPRWHDGRLWVSDWGANEVIAVDPTGASEVVARVQSFPMCIDHLPDGRLLIVSSADRRLLRREPDGSLVTHADLASLAEHPWNDIVVDGRGNAYVNNIGFDFPGGRVRAGHRRAGRRPTASSARWPTASRSRMAWPSSPTTRR